MRERGGGRKIDRRGGLKDIWRKERRIVGQTEKIERHIGETYEEERWREKPGGRNYRNPITFRKKQQQHRQQTNKTNQKVAIAFIRSNTAETKDNKAKLKKRHKHPLTPTHTHTHTYTHTHTCTHRGPDIL